MAHSAGLAGVVAGKTAISTVGKSGVGLTYRGYDIKELANRSNFEEVAYLLLIGKLPKQVELETFIEVIKTNRALPDSIKTLLKNIPKQTHPMDVMRTAVSMYGCLYPEQHEDSPETMAAKLLGFLPSALVFWHKYHLNGDIIETNINANNVAEHFLTLLSNKTPEQNFIRAFDTSLILYAEHEFNASTFAARVCTATLSDFYSAIVAAIGTLRGPLHGGANEYAMHLIEQYPDAAAAEKGIIDKLSRKDKIMGFGHRIYTTFDPRSDIIKKISAELSNAIGDTHLYKISEKIEKIMKQEKKLFPNLDFYAASCYHFLNIPTYLFTPLFVISRITGWAAHIKEQRADNRLIRPNAEYTGPAKQKYTEINDR